MKRSITGALATLARDVTLELFYGRRVRSVWSIHPRDEPCRERLTHDHLGAHANVLDELLLVQPCPDLPRNSRLLDPRGVLALTPGKDGARAARRVTLRTGEPTNLIFIFPNLIFII